MCCNAFWYMIIIVFDEYAVFIFGVEDWLENGNSMFL
jgi:hypothetical protein